MEMTLLQMVQDIHNDLDFDPVNSIDDTVESEQVAQIIKSTYYAMMDNRNWPHLRKTIKLESLSDSSMPTHLALPSNVKELIMLNYDCATSSDSTRRYYKEIKWLDPDAFLRKTNSRNSDNDNCDIVEDTTGVELLILNDKNPDYFTSFNDTNIIFDSYDSDISTTLLVDKCQCLAYVNPTWSATDPFVPDLPDEAFTALLEEAKSRAALKLKQEADQKAEQEAQRQNRWLSRKAWRVKGGLEYPNYGRKSVKMYRDPTFRQG